MVTIPIWCIVLSLNTIRVVDSAFLIFDLAFQYNQLVRYLTTNTTWGHYTSWEALLSFTVVKYVTCKLLLDIIPTSKLRSIDKWVSIDDTKLIQLGKWYRAFTSWQVIYYIYIMYLILNVFNVRLWYFVIKN